MRIYLAARYSRREELCRYREELRALGHDVQARWLDGKHQIGADGDPIGDHGEALVESTDSACELAAQMRARFAFEDFYDVSHAKVIVSFTEPPRQPSSNRGGRHVEFGIGVAMGKRMIVVGHRENLFHWLPDVEFFQTWEDAKAVLAATGN